MSDYLWKNIEDYEDKYKISNFGSIYDKIKNIIVISYKSACGYHINLYYNGKQKYVLIHTLVAKYFVDNPHNLKYVAHIDKNKFNNKADNLKWISYSEINNEKIVNKKNNFRLSSINILKSKIFELWLPINGFNNYLISCLGRIMSRVTGNINKQTINQGYYHITLSKSIGNKKIQRQFKIHILVAKTFVYNSNPNKNIVVDHINGNRLDNNAENLRWVTYKENSQSFVKHFRKHVREILQYDLNMNLIKEWANMREITQTYNYGRNNIYHSINFSTIAYGYIWKFKNKIEKKKIELKPDELFKNMGIINGIDFKKYEISNYGTVKNLFTNNFILPDYVDYCRIGLHHNNKQYKFFVHRLVAQVFVDGKTDKFNVVNHIDKNRKNNYYKNLEWTTYENNSAHSCGTKVNQMELKTNKLINTYKSISEASRILKIPCTCISYCCKGKAKTAGGYAWQFA